MKTPGFTINDKSGRPIAMWPQFPTMETLKVRAEMMGTDILTADQLQDLGVGRVDLSWGGFEGQKRNLRNRLQ